MHCWWDGSCFLALLACLGKEEIALANAYGVRTSHPPYCKNDMLIRGGKREILYNTRGILLGLYCRKHEMTQKERKEKSTRVV